jgi:D-aminoacyl-tRNA deacylase
MRLLLSVASSASVSIHDYAAPGVPSLGKSYSSSIGDGVLIYVGISHDDILSADEKITHIVGKLRSLQMFHVDGKLQGSLDSIGGQILLISNFTLYGEQKKGNRFDFSASAGYDDAQRVYEKLVAAIHVDIGDVKRVQTGEFGAMMEVMSVNNGPVNIVWDV